jgi:hypothetical protein
LDMRPVEVDVKKTAVFYKDVIAEPNHGKNDQRSKSSAARPAKRPAIAKRQDPASNPASDSDTVVTVAWGHPHSSRIPQQRTELRKSQMFFAVVNRTNQIHGIYTPARSHRMFQKHVFGDTANSTRIIDRSLKYYVEHSFQFNLFTSLRLLSYAYDYASVIFRWSWLPNELHRAETLPGTRRVPHDMIRPHGT